MDPEVVDLIKRMRAGLDEFTETVKTLGLTLQETTAVIKEATALMKRIEEESCS